MCVVAYSIHLAKVLSAMWTETSLDQYRYQFDKRVPIVAITHAPIPHLHHCGQPQWSSKPHMSLGSCGNCMGVPANQYVVHLSQVRSAYQKTIDVSHEPVAIMVSSRWQQNTVWQCTDTCWPFPHPYTRNNENTY